MDPTGEVLHIFGGITLGGIFGFGGGFIGSIIDQKKRGRKVDWRKAFGSGINGAITGAAQGGLLASGAGLPTALLTNFFAGAAGSAAEQYIGTGTVDPGSSITRGLTNAVSNAIYGTNPLRSARDAFLRGAGAGAATSGINYLSDFMGQENRLSGRRPGITPWVAGAALSPYGLHDPRLDCGGANPFAPGLGYHSDRGYQYDSPQSEGSQRKFSMWDFLGEVVMGGLTGGFTSAAFYGAGKGIERLKEGVQVRRNSGMYIPMDSDGNPIPLNKQRIKGQDIPLPDPAAEGRPHTVIGGRISSETGDTYRQSATFQGGSWPTANGYEVPISEVHWTDHGRANEHTNPHQHVFMYDFVNKYWYRSDPEMFYLKRK